jgi:hypothetical protein
VQASRLLHTGAGNRYRLNTGGYARTGFELPDKYSLFLLIFIGIHINTHKYWNR